MMIKSVCITFCFTFLVPGNYGSLHGDKVDLDSNEDALQVVLTRLNSLESKYHRLADDNVILRETVADLQTQVSFLKNENQQFQNEINALQTRDQQFENRRSSLVKDYQEQSDVTKNQLQALSPEDTTESDGNAIPTDNTKSTASVQMLDDSKPKRQISERITKKHLRSIQKRENEFNVAFFTTISNHHLQHLGANQTIVFDHVITNVGHAYNNHAGDFRAPVAGTYVFSVTLMALGTGTVHCQMVQNGHAVADIYVYGAEPRDATSSMTAVLELNQGEDIAIKNILADVQIHGYGYTYFSGFLLFQNNTVPAIIGK